MEVDLNLGHPPKPNEDIWGSILKVCVFDVDEHFLWNNDFEVIPSTIGWDGINRFVKEL